MTLSSGAPHTGAHTNARPHLLLRPVLLTGCLLLAHCGEEIAVENTLAMIEEPRDVAQTSSGTISVTYTLSDAEGDDQSILVEICEGSEASPTRCGLAVEGPGSDGVTFVPTQQGGGLKTHRFAWDAGCGRILAESDGELLASALDTNYVFRLRIRDARADWRYSDPFTLGSLMITELETCSLES